MKTCTAVGLLLLAHETFATVIRVPQDVATIQQALDAVVNGDTVSVAAGHYFEFLQAPPDMSFRLTGVPDSSTADTIPVVDPSPLPGATHLACLSLPSTTECVIEYFGFRNGPEMYPRENSSNVGGIVNNSLALSLLQCTFDSTYRGISQVGGGPLYAFQCQFRHTVDVGLLDLSPTPTVVSQCTFSGTGILARFSNSSAVTECTFQNKPDGGEWVWLTGTQITVRNCDFGPTAAPAYNVIWTSNSQGCRIEQNHFHDLAVTGAVMWFNADFGDTSYIQSNEFDRNHGTGIASAGGGVVINGETGSVVVFNENVFDSCSGINAIGFGALYIGSCQVLCANDCFRDRFSNLLAPELRTYAGQSAEITGCSFDNTAWAMWSDLAATAQFNWWGAPTGPYHATLNPGGLGDTITGPVDFIPWLTQDPFDTTTGVSDNEFNPHPTSFSLSAYPNPFNATTALSLSVETPGMYAIELYNTLGQRVKELWSGHVVGEQSITVHADDLSSGIYFACLRQSINRQALAITKLVMLK